MSAPNATNPIAEGSGTSAGAASLMPKLKPVTSAVAAGPPKMAPKITPGVLTIEPSGDVVIARRAGGPTQPTRVHINGFVPAAIRTANILLVYGIMRADLASR